MPKIFGPTVAPENHQLHVTLGVTMQTLASNYTGRKVEYTIVGKCHELIKH